MKSAHSHRSLQTLKGKDRLRADLWLQLSHQFLTQGEKSHAREALAEACAAPQKYDLFELHAADIAHQLDDLPFSLSLLESAFQKRQPKYPALFLAASISERLNRLESANHWIAEALSVAEVPLQIAEAKILQAKILIRQKQPQEAIELLRSFPHADQLPAKAGTEYHHTLFRAHDAEGDYENAYQALCRSKDISREFVTEDRLRRMQTQKKQSYLRLREIVKGWDSSELIRWQDEANQAREKSKNRAQTQQDIAFLLGHPRSGTTLLENILDSNDRLISSDEQTSFQDKVIDPLMGGFRPSHSSGISEINVELENQQLEEFRHYLDTLSPITLQKGRTRYLQSLNEELGCKVSQHFLLDKNPAITDAGLLTLRLFPFARFLFAVRDPRSVVWSSFTLPSYGTTWISCFWYDLTEAAEAYALFTDVWLAFREKLPSELSHTTRYEDVVSLPDQEGRAATEFLGLTWQDKQGKFYERAGEKHVHSPTYADVAKPVYTSALEKWKHYEPYLREGMPHLEKHLELFGYSQ